ncbi:hypothetical protein C0993_000457 [Termitomyces sp. T159_Od127]|nr:hypothetical protein C0993_000457 [Termitomyces sp. T159_Od127]
MAFLSPTAGYQATIAAYVMVGSVAALIWDILIHVDSDFELLFRKKIVYNQDKYIVAFFALLWLAVLGTSITAATVASAIHLGPTSYCVNAKLKPYASAASIAFAINDTFVFLAISWQLLSSGTLGRGRKSSIISMILGDYLSAFSRALLQDGQVYYLVSVTSNIVVVVIAWVGPLSYRLMFMILNITLTNMMSCQVFRHTKFGHLREDTNSTRWIASQLGHLDLEVGRERVKSPIHFLSFRTTENETDDSDVDWRGRPSRKPNSVITEEDKKGTDSAPTEKTEQ